MGNQCGRARYNNRDGGCCLVSKLETRVIHVARREDLPALEEAAEIIRAGGLVAFPTETVYGLGANALAGEAVRGIFAAKGRPADNPLIVHIAGEEELESLVSQVPARAKPLLAHFWPGPLTLILPKQPHIPAETTAGLDTVAVRMPAHPVALALIHMAGVPVAAPSANLSGRPSPTTAQHVLADLAGRVDMVIDGGPTAVGVESTVVDLTREPPLLLRPGGVTREELREFLPTMVVDPGVAALTPPLDVRPSSPGMKYSHYAPRAQVVVVEGSREAVEAKIKEMALGYQAQGLRVGILATRETAAAYKKGKVQVVGGREELAEVAANLYTCFRRFDDLRVDIILAEGFAAVGLGLAIMNRLRKAAGHRIIRVD
ncbi:MAG: threonylcarbamoyl-AMP synthase [Firmicutes bacterium]|nr:threonylcarbamoyl-AMP synthase [Bacillota bacterium]